MMNIDKYAYMSRLKRSDPLQKLFFAVLTLGVCLWADSIAVSLVVLLMMGWITVVRGGTPAALFLKMLLVPLSFLGLGVLTIAVNAAPHQNMFLVSLSVAGTHIGISRTGLEMALRLLFKALAAVSCLYYLSLSTPMVDLLMALERLKTPRLLIELMGLIYRFIFILLETADTLFTAQNSRLGYSGLATGYRSLAALVAALFTRSYQRADQLYTALEARGYNGALNVLTEPYERRWTGFVIPALLNCLLILGVLLLRHVPGGIP